MDKEYEVFVNPDLKNSYYIVIPELEKTILFKNSRYYITISYVTRDQLMKWTKNNNYNNWFRIEKMLLENTLFELLKVEDINTDSLVYEIIKTKFKNIEY